MPANSTKIPPTTAAQPRLRVRLGAAAPWVLSLGLHVAIALAAMGVAMVVIHQRPEAVVPETRWIDPHQPVHQSSKSPPVQSAPPAAVRQEPEPIALDVPDVPPPALSQTDATAFLDVSPTAAIDVPQAEFFGTAGRAHHVIYVIDRSGSMLLTFDEVRREVCRSISRLKSRQNFAIILFAEGKALAFDSGRLTPATRANKLAAAEFLSQVRLGPGTTALPALEQAFDILGNAGRGGKLIYLLTDGEFKPDAGASSAYRTPEGHWLDGSQAVLAWLEHHNPDGEIHISTILLQQDTRSSSQDGAQRVMRRIAREHGGQFRVHRAGN